jgi:hypothetical protein
MLAVSMASCKEQKLLKEYSLTYNYKVYDDVTYSIYFTNEIITTNCSITFIDHDGVEVTIADGQYKYYKLTK